MMGVDLVLPQHLAGEQVVHPVGDDELQLIARGQELKLSITIWSLMPELGHLTSMEIRPPRSSGMRSSGIEPLVSTVTW